MIDPRILDQADALGRQFATAQPFRHVVIDGFLQPEAAAALQAQFPAEHNPEKLVNEFGVRNPKKAISEVRQIGGIYADIDAYIQTPEFITFMERVTGISGLKYDPYYYGAGTHENFHGAGLDPHYDFNIHPITHQHRRLNAIVYLNRDWDPAWKGSIALHSDPWDLENDQVTEIPPDFNRCVVFETTESSWHSVPIIDQPEASRHISRRSFTIYMYTDERQKAELAPAHGTVYVQTGLPRHLKAGMVLSAKDLQEVQANITRRHEFLKQMYRREYKFSELIDQLKARIAELERHSRLPVTGPGKLGLVHAAAQVDGWVGRRLSFDVTPAADLAGVRITGWRPPEQPPVSLTLRAGGMAVTRQVSGSLDVTLPCPAAPGALLTITLDLPEATRFEGTADLRELSLMLGSIDLLPAKGA